MILLITRQLGAIAAVVRGMIGWSRIIGVRKPATDTEVSASAAGRAADAKHFARPKGEDFARA